MKRKGWWSIGPWGGGGGGGGGGELELFSAYKLIESISELRDV